MSAKSIKNLHSKKSAGLKVSSELLTYFLKHQLIGCQKRSELNGDAKCQREERLFPLKFLDNVNSQIIHAMHAYSDNFLSLYFFILFCRFRNLV